MAGGGTWPGRFCSRRRFGHGIWRPGLARHGRLRQQMVRQAAALALVVGACAGVQAVPPPLASAASSHATLIAAGNAHACMIRAWKAYCWGANGNGQLGNGSTINSSVPVPVYTGGVLSGKTLTQIVAGFSHTCALDSAGAAFSLTSGDLSHLSLMEPDSVRLSPRGSRRRQLHRHHHPLRCLTNADLPRHSAWLPVRRAP